MAQLHDPAFRSLAEEKRFINSIKDQLDGVQPDELIDKLRELAPDLLANETDPEGQLAQAKELLESFGNTGGHTQAALLTWLRENLPADLLEKLGG